MNSITIKNTNKESLELQFLKKNYEERFYFIKSYGIIVYQIYKNA